MKTDMRISIDTLINNLNTKLIQIEKEKKRKLKLAENASSIFYKGKHGLKKKSIKKSLENKVIIKADTEESVIKKSISSLENIKRELSNNKIHIIK